MQTDRPYRDEREAALSRVDRLERELAQTKRELERANSALTRRRRREWKKTMVGGTGALALILVVLLTLAAMFGGCVRAILGPTFPVARGELACATRSPHPLLPATTRCPE
jgi:hypothetical protein